MTQNNTTISRIKKAIEMTQRGSIGVSDPTASYVLGSIRGCLEGLLVELEHEPYPKNGSHPPLSQLTHKANEVLIAHEKRARRARKTGAFPCGHCEETYKHKGSLTTHMRRDHPKEQIPLEVITRNPRKNPLGRYQPARCTSCKDDSVYPSVQAWREHLLDKHPRLRTRIVKKRKAKA